MDSRVTRLINAKDRDWSKVLTASIGVATFIWGGWEFVFKEILAPATAPVNISLGIEVKTLSNGDNDDKSNRRSKGTPVLLTVSAKNSSGKTLKIKKSFWIAYGSRVIMNKTRTPEDVVSDINQGLIASTEQTSIDGASTAWQSPKDKWTLIGLGPLFDSEEIRPNEEIKAKRLIVVPSPKDPSEQYDVLRVQVKIPSFLKHARLAEANLIDVTGELFQADRPVLFKLGFCRVERKPSAGYWAWYFEKFRLPRFKNNESFIEPSQSYCPNFMDDKEISSAGAQIFTSIEEVPLKANNFTSMTGNSP